MNKCNDLEKEIAECQEQHVKEQEEWKKFQADLQTAVRVANDFLNEAEEKYSKIKEEYQKLKNKETFLDDQQFRLKENLKLIRSSKNYSNIYSNENFQELKDIQMSPRRSIPNHLLTSLSDSTNKNLAESVEFSSLSSSNSKVQFTQNTDTDDAKLLSTQVSKISHNIQNASTNSPSSASTASVASSYYNSDALANLVKQYGVSKRNALIKWCQEKLSLYKGIEIKNFSSSWNDGLAFCALLHSYIPDQLDYETLKKENNPKKEF